MSSFESEIHNNTPVRYFIISFDVRIQEDIVYIKLIVFDKKINRFKSF